MRPVKERDLGQPQATGAATLYDHASGFECWNRQLCHLTWSRPVLPWTGEMAGLVCFFLRKGCSRISNGARLSSSVKAKSSTDPLHRGQGIDQGLLPGTGELERQAIGWSALPNCWSSSSGRLSGGRPRPLRDIAVCKDGSLPAAIRRPVTAAGDFRICETWWTFQ